MSVSSGRFIPFVSDKEKAENTPAIIMESKKLDKKPKISCGRTNTGEIAPAENHATVILPVISEAALSCPEDNFLIKLIITDLSQSFQ